MSERSITEVNVVAPKKNVWDEGRWARVTKVDIDFMTKYIIEQMLACTSFENKRIAELGAGTGRLSYLLLKHGAEHVTMVDNSQKALALTQGLFQSEPTDRYQIVDSNVFDYQPEEKFDIVFSSGLIEHFQGKERFGIIEAHTRIAKSECVILVPSYRLYNRLADRTPAARKRYGFALNYSDREIKQHLAKMDNIEIVSNDRFHLFYFVPFLHNMEWLNRTCAKTFLEGAYGGLNLLHLRIADGK